MDTTSSQPDAQAEQPIRTTSFAIPRPVITVMQFVIAAALPILLVLINARLLMSETFVTWQYNQPNFPPDVYGFTQDERILYGNMGLQYLFNAEGIEFLGDLTFPDGSPLFNDRELSHMVDVKVVTRNLTTFGFSLLAVVLVMIGVMAAQSTTRPALWQSLLSGGILTVVLIVLGLIVTATSFRWLFTQFHALFFEGDSWLFLNSDTLIRLYPINFWVTSFAFMFGGALLQAIVVGLIGFVGLRRSNLAESEVVAPAS
ncbi:MAG: TIGR01906 family membrane protein [Chloroflexi bacterium]|nr:TIGR01906 family membrane protein [Chloroflexota bacterium]